MEGEQKELLIAEIQVSYKTSINLSRLPILKTPSCIYKVFMETWDETKIELVEQFKVMLLNQANRVLGICTLTTGNAVSTIADPKQVFAVALIANAVRIVIAHNHPSGNVNPSRADFALTDQMRMAGNFLDLKLMDHLIITKEGYYSFADNGLI